MGVTVWSFSTDELFTTCPRGIGRALYFFPNKCRVSEYIEFSVVLRLNTFKQQANLKSRFLTLCVKTTNTMALTKP